MYIHCHIGKGDYIVCRHSFFNNEVSIGIRHNFKILNIYHEDGYENILLEAETFSTFPMRIGSVEWVHLPRWIFEPYIDILYKKL